VVLFSFRNLFFLWQKLLDRERLVNWRIVMVENPSVGQSSGLFLCV
jgi:hypothetical protein